jgi:hypothetical protein
MDFAQAAALATAWVDIASKGSARIDRETPIAKCYGWIFFFQSNEFLDNVLSRRRYINARVIVDRNTGELATRRDQGRCRLAHTQR